MERHGEAVATTSEHGRVVSSRLSPGESRIPAVRPSIKFVLEGEERYEVDGRTYVVDEHRFLLIDRGPDCVARVRRGQGTRGLCVYLPAAGIVARDGEPPIMGRATVLHASTSALGRFLRDRAAQLHQGLEGEEEIAQHVVATTADHLAAIRDGVADGLSRIDAVRPRTRSDLLQRLESARAHLHENATRPVSQAELARIAGVSQFHLARLFRSAFGAPPTTYHRRLRLETANEWLRRGEDSVAAIAVRVGYSDASAFSHAFRRQFGRWPTESRAA